MRRQRDLNNKVTLKAWEHLWSHTQFSLPSFLISHSQSADVIKEGKNIPKPKSVTHALGENGLHQAQLLSNTGPGAESLSLEPRQF